MTPSERATTRERAGRVCYETLEVRIETALRRDQLERACILADVLATRKARQQFRRVRPRVYHDRPIRMVLTWRPIIDEICARHGLPVSKVISDYRDERPVAARQELWWTLNQRGASLQEIGRRVGGFHHTTVMYGVRQWEKKMANENREAVKCAA